MNADQAHFAPDCITCYFVPMNRPVDILFDKCDFLHWAEGREGRFELKDRRVEMMVGGSRNHARIIVNIAVLLRNRLDPRSWDVATGELAVEIGEDIRYPDVLVEKAGGDGAALSTTAPVFMAEVLSPSSLALDLNIKAQEYMSLSSLEAYIVAAQDEPRLWLWQRPAGSGPRPFPSAPEELAGRDAILRLTALGIEAGLDEIYPRG